MMQSTALSEPPSRAAPRPADKPAARLAVLRDFPEEGWPSMDLCGGDAPGGGARRSTPCGPRTFARRFGGDSAESRGWAAAARPSTWIACSTACGTTRAACAAAPPHSTCSTSATTATRSWSTSSRRSGRGFTVTTSTRFGVCLSRPASGGPRWFRAVARNILRGMQRAAVVFHSTLDVRDRILRHGLIDPGRLVHAPYGVSPEFAARPAGEDGGGPVSRPGGPAVPAPRRQLHPRKRIDVLLSVFGRVRERFGDLTLVQIGGQWTAAQQEQIARLGVGAGGRPGARPVARRTWPPCTAPPRSSCCRARRRGSACR